MPWTGKFFLMIEGQNIWLIPTTFGAVLNFIQDDYRLERIYLNNEAVDSLLDGDISTFNKLQEYGLPLTGLKMAVESLNSSRVFCLGLAEKNLWKLFSLHPLQMSIQVTTACNAKCDFCYANCPSNPAPVNLNIEAILQIKDYAAENGVKLGMSGGEPLLHPEIFKILEYRGDEVHDTLITNLISDFDIERLASTQVDQVQASIHGPGKIHDSIVGVPNAYQIAMSNMTRLLEDLNVATNTVITPQNIDDISALIHDFSELQETTGRRFTYCRLVAVLPSGAGLGHYSLAEEFTEDVKNLLLHLKNDFMRINFELPMLTPSPYEYFEKDGKYLCPAGSTVAVVRADGHVSPCNQFVDSSIFSERKIHDAPFHEIWLNDPVLSDLRRGRSFKTNNCTECAYLTLLHSEQ